MTTGEGDAPVPDASIDLPTVAKHNWKTTAARDRWAGPLGAFPAAFERAAEVALTDADHLRRAIQRTVPAEAVRTIVDRAPDGVDVTRETRDESVTVAMVAPDAPVGAGALLAGDLGPYEALRVRGVPECCAERCAARRSEGRRDPVAAVAEATPSTSERADELVVEDPHPILNTIWAYAGWRFVDFHPCSFECDRARAVALETGRLLRAVGAGDVAEAAFDFVAAPTYWSGYHGLAHVKNEWCIGEYTSDDYWRERIVRFGGYHDASPDDEGTCGDGSGPRPPD